MKTFGRHLFQGFKFAVPFIILYSIALAIDQNVFALGNVPDYIYMLIIPILTAAIANSITSKILILPSLFLGYYLEEMGLGFFGGIIGGFLIGYTALGLTKIIHVKHTILSLILGYIVVAGIALGCTYLVVVYVVEVPFIWVIDSIRNFILGIQPTQIVFLVAVLAALTTVDLGGPFNKLAYSFVLQFYLDGYYYITGPALISVAIPPIAIYLSLKVLPNRFNKLDHTSKKLAFFAALVGLTEGALAVSFRRPLKMIPIIVLGSVSASVFAAYFHLENVLLMSSILGLAGASNILIYVLAHILGVGLIVFLFFITLPKHKEQLHVE